MSLFSLFWSQFVNTVSTSEIFFVTCGFSIFGMRRRRGQLSSLRKARAEEEKLDLATPLVIKCY